MGGQIRTEKGDELQGTFFWNLYGKCYDSVNHLIPYRKLLYDSYVALGIKPGYKILDAGCGTGNFEKFIAGRNIPSIEIEAVDFSPVMLSCAKKKCKDLKYVNFALVDLNEKLPYSDNTFDRILCVNVLYALKDPGYTLSEFLRILKPNGKVIIANPKPNAQFVALIQDHFKRITNIWGFHRKLWILMKTLIMLPTTGLAPILLNVFVIKQKGKKQQYYFLPKGQYITVFNQNNFKNIDIDSTYADQNWLVVATKVSGNRGALKVH